MQEDLKKLGLTDNEIKVYLSLLKIGETPVGGIINDLKIHRQIAYNALDALERKNMVAKTMKNKIFHYNLSDPEVLVDNLKSQELIAERLSHSIKVEMKKSRHENEVYVFSGLEKVRTCFLDKSKELSPNAELFAINATGKQYRDVLGEKFFKKIEEVRDKKNIVISHVVTENYKVDIEDFAKNLRPGSRQIKYLPYSLSEPIATVIWPDSVMFQFAFCETPFVILIKNDNIRETFLGNFRMLWKMAKR